MPIGSKVPKSARTTNRVTSSGETKKPPRKKPAAQEAPPSAKPAMASERDTRTGATPSKTKPSRSAPTPTRTKPRPEPATRPSGGSRSKGSPKVMAQNGGIATTTSEPTAAKHGPTPSLPPLRRWNRPPERTEITGTLYKIRPRDGGFDLEVYVMLVSAPGLLVCHQQMLTIPVERLPASLAWAPQAPERLPVAVRCDVSGASILTEVHKDGFEDVWEDLAFEGPVAVLGLYSRIEVSAVLDTVRGSLTLSAKAKERRTPLPPEPSVIDKWTLTALDLDADPTKGRGALVGSFERRVLTTLRSRSLSIYASPPQREASCEIDLRGLDAPWVPDFIRDAPIP